MQVLGKVRFATPLKLLTLFNVVLSVGLLAWAIVLEDGCAFLAILLVSLASCSHSGASFWMSNNFLRSRNAMALPGDIFIRI